MKPARCLFMSCVALVLVEIARGAPPQVPVAVEGTARLPIVAGSVPEPVQELQKYLKRISGAEFRIEKSVKEGTPGIYVGLAADFPSLKIDKPADLGPEGFVMKTDGGGIYLVGNQSTGVEHAVTTFLQKLGCRWFFPGATWEVVPQQKTIAVQFDERQKPAFPHARHIWYGFGAYGPCAADFKQWNHHNRMGGSMPAGTGHTWFGLDRSKFKDHPEWFALSGGQRTTAKPCYSHPDVIKQAIRHCMDQAASGAPIVSMSPPDGLSFCECERCKACAQGGQFFHKHGTLFARRPDGVVVSIPSETVFNCVNEAARVVAEKYPKTRIGCNAYSAYSHPPSFKLHPRVFVQITTAYRRTDLSLAETLAAFRKQGCEPGIRDYFSVYQWDWDVAPPRGKFGLDKIQEHYQGLHQNGVTSITGEASNNWAPRGLSYYLSAQLMWDVNADQKALLRDFFDRAFGPAAKPMERYYIHWYGASAEETKAELEEGDAKEAAADSTRLQMLFKDLDEAAQLAKDRPDCLARIDHLRMYVHYLVLRRSTQQAGKGKKIKDKKALIEAVKNETVFGGRLTYTNMIHSRPLLGKAFERRFRKYKRILDDVPEAHAGKNGWRQIGQPPSHAEMEKLWADDRVALQVK